MENRKRNIQMKFYVTEEEKRLIDEKMKQLPIKQYVAMGATWLSTILPSAGIGMQNNFLSQLADFNYLNIGGMSFWTPHVILISAGIELFVFTFLAIHSYCRHQVA